MNKNKLKKFVIAGTLTGILVLTVTKEETISLGLDTVVLKDGHAAIKSENIKMIVEDNTVIPCFVQEEVKMNIFNIEGYYRIENILSGCELLYVPIKSSIQDKDKEFERLSLIIEDFKEDKVIYPLNQFLSLYYSKETYDLDKEYYTRFELREKCEEIEAILKEGKSNHTYS